MAFKVDVSSALSDELDERQAVADEAGAAELRLDGLAFALKRSRRRDSFPFENSDLRAVFDRRGAGGWNLEVVIRAVFLATHPLAESIALGTRVARAFGAVHGSRLRRFDLAADYVNFPLERGDADHFVTTRAKISSFMPEAKDFDEVAGTLCRAALREDRTASHQVTGIVVAPGNPLMARVYAKDKELALTGREAKREIEHALWRSGGWDGKQAVTRVEFQHRGEYLDETELRDPSALEGALDGVWARDAEWLRLTDRESAARATRRALDPRWVAVSSTTFIHESAPIQRTRLHRGGAKPEHVRGSLISRLASSGELGKLDYETSADGEVLTEASFTSMPSQEAADWLERTVGALFWAGARDSLNHLARTDDVRRVASNLFAKLKAAEARFSSVDDEGQAQ